MKTTEFKKIFTYSFVLTLFASITAVLGFIFSFELAYSHTAYFFALTFIALMASFIVEMLEKIEKAVLASNRTVEEGSNND